MLQLFNEEGLREPQQLGIILMILTLFAWAMAPLMYLASFLFTVPSSGFTRMSMLNIFTGETSGRPLLPLYCSHEGCCLG